MFMLFMPYVAMLALEDALDALRTGVKLRTINTALWKLGLVLVVRIDDNDLSGPTSFIIERSSKHAVCS